MRRDLTRGCAACRLRFSERLTQCPVCRGAALTVQQATSRVQPTSRAAWLAKWLVVLPSIPAVGVVIWAGTILLREGWPPKNAIDVIIYVLGAMGTCLGVSIAVAVPIGLWFGLMRAVQFILKFIVDRPRRALRVTIETAPRSSAGHARHPMHRLWGELEAFEVPQRVLVGGVLTFLGIEVLAEIFGDERVVKFTSWSDFGESLLVLALMNAMGAAIFAFFIGIFGAFTEKAKDYLDDPPPLFGYDPTPPPVQNEACVENYLKNRDAVVGRAEPLDEAERKALEMQTVTQLVDPLSSKTCFAFRILGDADGQPIDDADATSFAVVTRDQQRCVVTAADVVVTLPSESNVRGTSARGFLQERGLPERNVKAGISLIEKGDLVRVVGRRTNLRVGTAGYRGEEQRMMLDAGDGLPVVIQAANEAPT